LTLRRGFFFFPSLHHNNDNFADALKQHGLLIPDTANFKVAGSCHSSVYGDHRTVCDIFIERDSWDKGGGGPAYLLFNHPFYPGKEAYPGQQPPFYTS
jgi:hypothetical protein